MHQVSTVPNYDKYNWTNNGILSAGTFTKGPIRFKDDLMGSLLTFIGCNPGKLLRIHAFLLTLQWSIISGFCFCKDAPTVEIDVRQQFLKEVMDLCPKGRMDRCLCSDNTKITWPFTQFDVINCGPKKVIQWKVAIVTSNLSKNLHPRQVRKSDNL